MRLTLRTLLAYLDDFLEPEDSEDIAKKIEESEFATQLVHRTRDCTRRLRLGVPPVIGRGLASDPNTVAEYLDNTLAGDRVPEFEKICLESDVHLGEVASCHQILTLVLGGAVEIPQQARDRMYALASHVDAPPVQPDAMRPVMATAVESSTPPPTRRAKPEVPDYLRESRSRLWPVAATVLVTAFLTFVALLVLNPGDWRERILALANSPAESTEEPATSAETEAPTTEEEAAVTEPSERESAPAATAEETAPTEPAAETAPDDNLAAPREPDEDPNAPPAPNPDDALGVAATDATADAPEADMPEPSDRERPSPRDAARPVETTDEPAPLPLKEADEATPAAAVEAAPARDAEPESFGRYMSTNEVLLRFDAGTGDWKRLPARSPILKGDRLLSLPSFRPTITLSSNIAVQAEGAALIELVGWSDQGVPIIDFQYGRFVLNTVGRAGNNLLMKFDDEIVQLTFVDADSTAAIESRRILPPGKDPLADAAPLAVDLYATSGLLRIRQGDASLELQGPAHKTLFGPSGQQGELEVPKWVNAEPFSDFDRKAATTIEPLLPADDRPIGLKLRELASDRRREVRALAIRSACYLDNFEPIILSLNDKDEKNMWTGPDAPYIQELRSAIARSGDTAGKVRAALEKKRANDAPALYRMLWGYSGEDLVGGADRDLVEALDKDALDMQVLAFWNLQNVTGLPNFGYHPGETAAKRRQAVKAWQTKLREGKIAPKAAAAPTNRSKAPAKAVERNGS